MTQGVDTKKTWCLRFYLGSTTNELFLVKAKVLIVWIIIRINYNYFNGKEVTVMKVNLVKVAGMAATVIGTAATLIGSWANDKQQDAKIAKKVAEAIAKTKGES